MTPELKESIAALVDYLEPPLPVPQYYSQSTKEFKNQRRRQLTALLRLFALQIQLSVVGKTK